jgi:Peptidase family M50
MTASPATQFVSSHTPILDRLQPLPKADKVRSYESFFKVLFDLITFFLFLYFSAIFPGLRQRFDNAESPKIGLFVGLLLLFVAAVTPLIIHELAHLFVGKWAGFRFRHIRFGPLQIDHSFKFSRSRNHQSSVLGAVLFFSAEMKNHPWKFILMVIAGPAANIATTAIFSLPFDKSFFLLVFALVSLYLGVANLVPSRTGFSSSDGLKILTILFKRTKHERTLAFAELADELRSGVDLEMLPADLIREVTAAPDDSLISCYSYSIAYAWAYYKKDNSAAANFLENRLAFSRTLGPKFRGAIMVDAAIFQAERRENISLAEQWLADLPDFDDTKAYRVQAEGAILEARGDFNAALEKIAECAKQTQTMANEKMQQEHLKRLNRWKQDVQEKLLKEQHVNSGPTEA